MGARERLDELGITLPQPPEPAGAYTRAVRSGNLLFVAGQLPLREGTMAYSGSVGEALSFEEGYEAARVCALNGLGVIQEELGSLDAVARIVRLTGYVTSGPGFVDQAQVVNGASELMAEIFGDRGVHARLAVGVIGLPLGAAVELEIIAEVV
mgnify:FL=1